MPDSHPTPDAAVATPDRFLLDVMLGKLATYLRMCGYDAAYALDRGVEADDRILELVADEGRTLLTRDEALAARADDAVLLTARDVTDQLRELREAGYHPSLPNHPERCSRCNAGLERVAASASVPAYAPDPSETAVWRCPACGQHYWRGSHWDDVRRRVADVGDERR